MLSFCGSWQLTVLGADACWPQRVVVTGGARMVIPGRVGEVATVAGDRWWLTVEHDPGDGWRPNVRTLSGVAYARAGRLTQLVRSKNRDRLGDRRPNALVLSLVTNGPVFGVGPPFAVRGADLRRAAAEQITAERGECLLGIEVTNTGPVRFDDDLVLDVSARGRGVLDRHGVHVMDRWPAPLLAATGQEVYDSAVSLPPLSVGATALAYLPVSSDGTGGALPPVEFELRRLGGDPSVVLDRATAAGVAAVERFPGRPAAGARFGPARHLRRD